MAIDQRFLDELTARCDIVDVVSRYVALKKSGSNYFGLCPFHGEKTASFSVAPDKQIFHCFGCGAGGGVISFIMKIEGLEFQDAVRHLARQQGMEVPETGVSREDRKNRDRLLALMKDAGRFYYAQLHHPQNAPALQYFVRRGLSGKTMNRFGLGYAPDSFHALMDAMQAKGYTKAELDAAGLIGRSKQGTYYDKFRNRVIFPIIDIRGDVIAFGGRVMDDSTPKYLNSPETYIFGKSRNLFAMNLAKKTKNDYFLLAEGYMDVIALHQAGFDSAVASLGTALTEEQARLMSRYTNEVVICYDADNAGQKAAQRAIDILNRAGLRVKVLRIPGAKDPDEFIKAKGSEAFRKLIERSENHIEYRLQRIRDRYDMTEDEQRIGYLNEAAEELAALDNEIEREVYTGRVAKDAGVSVDSLKIQVEKALNQRRRRQKTRQRREVRAPAQYVQPNSREIRYDNVPAARAEEGMISLILADNTLLGTIRAQITPEDFTSPDLRSIFEEMCRMEDEEHPITVTAFEGRIAPEQMDLLTRAVQRCYVSRDRRGQAMEDYLQIMRKTRLSRRTAEGQDPMLELAGLMKKKKRYQGPQG